MHSITLIVTGLYFPLYCAGLGQFYFSDNLTIHLSFHRVVYNTFVVYFCVGFAGYSFFTSDVVYVCCF